MNLNVVVANDIVEFNGIMTFCAMVKFYASVHCTPHIPAYTR